MIYAVGNMEYGIIKVGFTKTRESFKKRKSNISTAFPYKLESYFLTYGGVGVEKSLHRILRKYGTYSKGEWFFIDDIILNALCKAANEVKRGVDKGAMYLTADDIPYLTEKYIKTRCMACVG